MKKLIFAIAVISLNFVSCTSDDIQQENQQIINADDNVLTNPDKDLEIEPVKDKTKD